LEKSADTLARLRWASNASMLVFTRTDIAQNPP
jgi:hypothetical protein